jgi:putative ABC transport system ATP-binding protein
MRAVERAQTATMAPDCVMIMRGLWKRKGPADRGWFRLDVPDMQLRRGKLHAIVGDSGCGKTTLLDIMALIAAPDGVDRFEVRTARGDEADIMRLHDGGDAALAALRARFGYVLQTGGLLPFLTVGGNARLPFEVRGETPDHAAVQGMADRLGIGDKLAAWPRQLSGGQRQRAAILRALAHRPEIVLADEPTAAVDTARARGIMEDLAAVARARDACVVIVTHDPELVHDLVDHAWGFRLEDAGDESTVSTCVEIPLETLGSPIRSLR